MSNSISAAGRIRSVETVEDLLGPTAQRVRFKTADSLSGSRFEKVEIAGERYVLKFLCADDDWIMRATGDLHARQLRFWRSELVGRLPHSVDHAVVGCADYAPADKHRGGALLLRDVSDHLVSTASLVPLRQHHRFLEHMAAMHAQLWGWRDDLELMPLAHHYLALTSLMAATEREFGGTDEVPPRVAKGWQAFPAAAPRLASLVMALAEDPGPLVDALRTTPHTMVHGDWKFGNMGTDPKGRTILLDWDRCGEGPACLDLAWYLAVNCDLLPETKDEAILHYRRALRTYGVDDHSWWDKQLSLALLGGFLQLGWSKVGDPAELAWWEKQVLEGSRYL